MNRLLRTDDRDEPIGTPCLLFLLVHKVNVLHTVSSYVHDKLVTSVYLKQQEEKPGRGKNIPVSIYTSVYF